MSGKKGSFPDCREDFDEELKRQYHCLDVPKKDWAPTQPFKLGPNNYDGQICPSCLSRTAAVTTAMECFTALKGGYLDQAFPEGITNTQYEALLILTQAYNQYESWMMEQRNNP